MEDFERDLRQRVEDGNLDALVQWASNKLRQSYRNGLYDGKKDPDAVGKPNPSRFSQAR